MISLLLAPLWLFVSTCPSPQIDTVRSLEVGDDFRIVAHPPKDGTTPPPLILYLDAGLRSGKQMPDLIRKKNKNALIVGVGHVGDYRSRRRRDFIPAHIPQEGGGYRSDHPYYGQAERFHAFLEKELLPFLEREYGISKHDRTIIGHSLGGLFVVYASLRPQRLFQKHIAISPSLWANRGNIWDFERDYHSTQKGLHTHLYLCAGSLETLNLVLRNVNLFHQHLEKREYRELRLHKRVFKGYHHHAVVNPAVSDALEWLGD